MNTNESMCASEEIGRCLEERLITATVARYAVAYTDLKWNDT